MAIKKSELYSSLWASCDELRGGMDASQYKDYLFESSKQYLFANAGITATNIISKRDFSEVEFFVPKIEEQAAIATVLSDMDAEIAALEA
jgi:restriction endonuclease S subunit